MVAVKDDITSVCHAVFVTRNNDGNLTHQDSPVHWGDRRIAMRTEKSAARVQDKHI